MGTILAAISAEDRDRIMKAETLPGGTEGNRMGQYSHFTAVILHLSRREKNAPKIIQRSGFSFPSQPQELPSLASASLPQPSA